MGRQFSRITRIARFSNLAWLLFAAALVLSDRPARGQSVTPQLAPEPFAFDFYARGPYKADLPRPAALLGYEPGEFHTTYANYERFLRELAPKSDRLKVFTLAQTPEHRPLYLLAVSMPENLAKLDAIKADLAKLADPRVCSQADADAIAAHSPEVVWLSYSIHGDESAAFEAGMQVLYQLTASEDPKIVEALKNVVVLINPAQNPDGHERFTAWYNAQGLGRPEPFAYEHRQPWGIWGRFNHYYFDLNRDLIAGSQTESKAAMKAFVEWHPQVNADHHGEVANYFFPPPALPVNQALPREETNKWMTIFGRGNAAAFDQFHWLYYSRDVFDLYYPGYWDSWPSLHGSIGMTYETGGGGKRGLNYKRDDETIEPMKEAIAKHFTASLSTVETAAAHREERLQDYYKFFATAIEEGKAAKDGLRQVVISPGKDPARTEALMKNLVRHGVELQWAQKSYHLPHAYDYANGTVGPKDFPTGSFVVDLAQPQSRVARTLLSPDAPLDADFVKRQLDRQARNLHRGRHEPTEQPEFYDITAWCLPLAFGMDAAYSPDAIPPDADLGGVIVDSPDLSPLLQPTDRRDSARTIKTELARASTAYVWTPETEGGYRLAFKLLQEGYRVATATYPLRAGGKDYPRGTFVARVERNPANLHDHIASLIEPVDIPVDAVNTAFADQGQVGVGSEAIVALKAPKVALIAGDETAQTSYGEISYLLGHEYGVEYVPLSVSAFNQARMADFNVLILPDGSPKAYKEAFDKDGVAKLKAWCKDGGTLICVGGAAGFAADPKVNLTGARVVAADLLAKLDEADEKDEDSASGKPSSEKERKAEGKKPAPPEPDETPAAKAKEKPDDAAKSKDEKATDDEGKSTDKADKKEKLTVDDAGKTDDLDRYKIPLPVPGAILRAKVNRQHFLTYGYEQDTLPILVDTDQFLTPTKRGANVLTFPPVAPPGKPPTPALRLAGFVWPDNTERLIGGTSAVVEEPLGDGHVILTANGPSFRMIWHATTRLWLNAILYAPAMRGGSDD